MSRIFISYRRQDTGGHAQNLHNRLCSWFDAQAELFFDTASIESGDVFPQTIQAALDAASVVLVLIGPGWLEELNRRSALPGVDFVRHEVATALQRQQQGQALVVPVLLGGATMPSAADLADTLRAELAGLCALDAHGFHFQGKQADWDAKFVQLRQRIASRPEAPREQFRLLPGRKQAWRVLEQDVSRHFHDPNGWVPSLHGRLQSGEVTAVVGATRSELAHHALSLYGMGGIGKTQLALAYSHLYRDVYAGVWWLRAQTPGELEQDCMAACRELYLPVAPTEAPSTVFKRWLGQQREQSWLLVFDNAEDPAVLRPFLPGPGPHRVLITSRRADWRGLGQPFELQTWTPEQGLQFLARWLGNTAVAGGERAAALALSTELGGLPLALEMAAGYVERYGLQVSEYLVLWREEARELLRRDEEDPSRASTGYAHTVATSLSLAWRRLSEAAQQLLQLLGQAAPEAVWEPWIQQGVDFLPPALAAVAHRQTSWLETVGELTRHGLAKPGRVTDGEQQPRTLTLHRLMQQVVKLHLAGEWAAGECWSRLLHLACPDKGEVPPPGQWPRLNAVLPHAVWQADAEAQTTGWAGECCARDTWVVNRCARALYAQGSYAQAEQRLRTNQERQAERLGAEHPYTLTSSSDLAVTLRGQGKLAAAKQLDEVVLITRRRVLGEEHRDTLISMHNLALILQTQGKYAEAKKTQETVLAAQRRVLGEEHPDTLTSMNNLATTLQAQGKRAEAKQLQETVLVVQRRILGEEHPDTLASTNNLASTLQAQRKHAEAKKLQETVLAVRRRVLGNEHPDTLASMNNLALTLQAQGKHTEAKSLHETVLAVHRRVLGEEHPNTLTSMNNLAFTLWSQQERKAAIALMERVVIKRTTILGSKHPDTQASQQALTQWRQVQKTGYRPVFKRR